MGYRKRTSFLAGLTVAQISEFSLIFAGLGYSIGHITQETVALITLVGLITIGLSTYLILYSHKIYEVISPALEIFQRENPYREPELAPVNKEYYDLIIFGLGRFGGKIARLLNREHPEVKFLGVDFDPSVVRGWQEEHRNIVYGDIEDPELLERIPFKNAGAILSTVSDREHSLQLLKTLKRSGYTGKVFLTAIHESDHLFLNTFDVSEVLLPHQMAAQNFYNSFLQDMFPTPAEIDKQKQLEEKPKDN